ncbi:hypothetical protein E8L90_05410 [Brevibacillus antibioticus]|uniref:Uncharacterized protein n=1 Tax=Brevibacillus antibioticus TaxID=2570228 RepID=A0A4U2Y3E9_9BACL|nr:hypothetical protein E8L90_05410 [Brevibacillus antibioticus]
MDMSSIGINIFKKEVNAIIKQAAIYKLNGTSIDKTLYWRLERNNLYFEVDDYDNALIFAKDGSIQELLFGIHGHNCGWVYDDESIKNSVKRTLEEVKQEILPLEKNEELRKKEEIRLRKEQEEKEKNERIERIKKMLS